MKKIIAGITLALMVAVLPLGLVGCNNSIYGSYTYYNMYAEYDDNVSAETKQSAENIIAQTKEGLKDVKLTLKINKDGTANYIMKDSEVNQTINGTWKKEGNHYLVTFNFDDQEVTNVIFIKNGVLKVKADFGIDGVTAYQCFKK